MERILLLNIYAYSLYHNLKNLILAQKETIHIASKNS